MSSVQQLHNSQQLPVSAHDCVQRWLSAFERALAGSDAKALTALFHDDSHWRDILAFTWHIKTTNGAKELAAALIAAQASIQASDLRIASRSH